MRMATRLLTQAILPATVHTALTSGNGTTTQWGLLLTCLMCEHVSVVSQPGVYYAVACKCCKLSTGMHCLPHSPVVTLCLTLTVIG